MATTYSYSPDYAVHPGETLKEVLENKGMKQSELSSRTGISEKTISQIIKGIASISYDTADKLDLTLGVPARFWNSREAQYQEALLRIKELERLQSEKDWLKLIPLKEMIRRGFIQASDDNGILIREAFSFFQVTSIETWNDVWIKPQVLFRGAVNQPTKAGLVAAWVRMAEIQAESIECNPFDEAKFKKSLQAARDLTTKSVDTWEERLTELCEEAGVAFVLVKEIKTASVSGVAKWLNPQKAMIALSLKYKTDDQFWFSFFHEAGHILKHKRTKVFYDGGKRSQEKEEKEADGFARNILIPEKMISEVYRSSHSSTDIKRIARELGVSPGIVVGRLQHDEMIPITHNNDLKIKLDWKE